MIPFQKSVAVEYAEKLIKGGEADKTIQELVEKISEVTGFDGVVNLRQSQATYVVPANSVEIGKCYLCKDGNNAVGIMFVGTSYGEHIVCKMFTGYILYTSDGSTLASEDTTLSSEQYMRYYSAYNVQWDTTPTENSVKAVTSGGVKSYVDNNKGTKLYKHSIVIGTYIPGPGFTTSFGLLVDVYTNSNTPLTKANFLSILYDSIYIVRTIRISDVSYTPPTVLLRYIIGIQGVPGVAICSYLDGNDSIVTYNGTVNQWNNLDFTDTVTEL